MRRLALLAAALLAACATAAPRGTDGPTYDLLIRDGRVMDGSGGP